MLITYLMFCLTENLVLFQNITLNVKCLTDISGHVKHYVTPSSIILLIRYAL